MFVFKGTYFITFVSLLLIEVSIALWSGHPFIRGFIGDVVVVLLLYTFLKSFLSIASEWIATGVLILAFGIEFLQYFKITEILKITHPALKVMIGSVFDPCDLLAYTTGFCLILLAELLLKSLIKP
jgi:DNA integrity scanning protein DisA with diadenylate cyclase activity